MVLTLEQFRDAALDLPESDRTELVTFLLDSLSDRHGIEARDDWLTVAQMRMADIKNGTVAGIPAADVLSNLLELIR